MTATTPPVEGQIFPTGYDGRYRLYTIAHLPFDALPSYAEGGPAKVVLDPWDVSTTSPTEGEGGRVTLNVYPATSRQTGERHPLDGTRYDDREDADRAAYDAGLLAFMVYERDAARYGLPTAERT